MENQQLTTRPQSAFQLARPSSTSEAAVIMRRFEQLSELAGWAGILHALAQDKRHDLAPHVIELWKVKLAPYRDEDIAQILIGREWRFFPSVDEVIAQLQRLAESRYQEREALKAEELRRDREAALKEWEDPAVKAEHERIVRQIAENLSMRRLHDLHLVARRSPENVKALSQAKALRTAGVKYVA